MKEILVAVRELEDEEGRTHRFSYYRLEDGRDYGVCVKSGDGGAAMLGGVTSRRRRVDALLRRLVRGAVSPAHLREVVEDWLAA